MPPPQPNTIKTLKELLAQFRLLYKKGEVLQDGWFPVYFTEKHKEKNLVGWIPMSEIKNFLKAEEDEEKAFFQNLWKLT